MDAPASPFHDGEVRLQASVGRAERMEAVGRVVIRPHMPAQHIELFTKLPFVLVGSLDAAGRPWASVLAGAPGFISAPDEHHLRLHGHLAAADPLRAGLPGSALGAEAGMLQAGAPIGVLGIEPHTRRRNRMNGVLTHRGPEGFEVAVRQSFGNCPKYIHPRQLQWLQEPAAMAQPRPVEEEGPALSARALQMVAAADTFFIASASAGAAAGADGPGEGVDVSHRGGPPGFVRVGHAAGGATVLTVPDYSGNSMFNTLGNLLVHPWAGLLFIDFAAGDLLWLQAQAEIDLDAAHAAALPGAERLLHLQVQRGRRVSGVLPWHWEAAADNSAPA